MTNRITREAVLDMADDADAVIAVKLAANKPFSSKIQDLPLFKPNWLFYF